MPSGKKPLPPPKQMITNRENFKDGLLHRLAQCFHLAEDSKTLSYLPEMLIRTLKDAYRLMHQKEAQNNTPALCFELGISLTPEQGAMLLAWEDAMRGEEKYTGLSIGQKEALAFAQILQRKIETF